MRGLGEKKFQDYTKGNMDTVVCVLLICISLCSISVVNSAAVHSRNGYSDALQLEDRLPPFLANDHASLDQECIDTCGLFEGDECTYEDGKANCFCGEDKKFVLMNTTAKDDICIEKKKKECEDTCGKLVGVKCKYEEGRPTCSCNGDKKFISKDKGCLDKEFEGKPVSFCDEDKKFVQLNLREEEYNCYTAKFFRCALACGVAEEEGILREPTVMCKIEEGNVTCYCDGDKKFVSNRGCLDQECIDTCGVQDNVQCKLGSGKGSHINCSCKDDGMKFHSEAKGCTSPIAECSDVCGNYWDLLGIQCDFVEGTGAHCSCKDITKKFLSSDKGCTDPEVECRDACGNLRGVSCTFVEGKGPQCLCDGDNMKFVPEEDGCGETCGKDKMCFNGGTCESGKGGKVCACPEGTGGVSCEIVAACKDKDCGTEAKCRWDIDKKGAVCRCDNKTLSFDGKVKKCKEMCNVDRKCLNGGKCEARGGGSFCACPEGTEGFFCETIPACRGKDCGSDAKCVLDIDKKVAVCRCDSETLSFDEKDKKCKETCDDDKKCINGGTCRDNFCACPAGTGGSFCETCDVMDCGSEAKCWRTELGENFHKLECRCDKSDLIYDDNFKKCKVSSLASGYIVLIFMSAIVSVSLITGAIIYFIKKRQRR